MNDELSVVSSLDQPLAVSPDEELEKIDEIIKYSIRQGDPEIVFRHGFRLLAGMQIRGWALAKLLYLVEKSWDDYEIGDDFYDTVTGYLALHKNTIKRYIDVWDSCELIPPKLLPEFQQKAIRTHIPISSAIAQGYEIDDNTWQDLADAPDLNTVSRIVREDVRGEELKTGSISLSIDRDGSIYAFSHDQRYFIGSLEVDHKVEVAQKAINRIIKNSGIMQA